MRSFSLFAMIFAALTVSCQATDSPRVDGSRLSTVDVLSGFDSLTEIQAQDGAGEVNTCDMEKLRQTCGPYSMIGMVPFVNDISSGIGDVQPYVTLRMSEVPGDPMCWSDAIADDLRLIRMKDGVDIGTRVELTELTTNGPYLDVRILLAPLASLDADLWYAISIPEIPDEFDGLVPEYILNSEGAPDWYFRFKLGHDAVLRTILFAEGSMSVVFSESLRSVGDDIDFSVTQDGDDTSLCSSSVPQEHWKNVGTYHLDAKCEKLDLTRPINIAISGRLVAGDAVKTLQGDSEVFVITVAPESLRPCSPENDGCMRYSPMY